MNRFLVSAPTVLLAAGWLAIPPAAGQMPAEPTAAALRAVYADAKANALGAAELMPEADYAYRPAEEVRTFGQQIAHIADAQYIFCSAARNEASPIGALAPGQAGPIETGKSTKAEIVAALEASFEYCDAAYEAATDRSLAEAVRFLDGERPRAFPLLFGVYHTSRHYGSVIVYLREKGLVPPSTANAQRPSSQ